MIDEIRASDLQPGDTFEEPGDDPIHVVDVDRHGDTILITGTYEGEDLVIETAYDTDLVVTLLDRTPPPAKPEPPENWWLVVETSDDDGLVVEANVAVTAGSARLNLRFTTEGLIADSYNRNGDCIGTIGDNFDGWAERIENDPAQKAPWHNDLVQFARLLSEIAATHSEIDFPGLRESMDLDEDDIDELFDRAHRVWEAAKDRDGRLDTSGRVS